MIKRVEIFPVQLPVKRDFKIAGGVVASSSQGAPHIFVKITDHEGSFGWGECRPSHRWSYETLETVTSTLKNYIAPELIGMDEKDIESAHKKMNSVIAGAVVTGQPIAKSAVDMALFDLNSKKAALPLYRFLSDSEQNQIKLSAIISAQSPEEAVSAAELYIDEGFEGFKIKAGINTELDLEIIKSVSEISKDIFIVVDANQSWDMEKTIKISRLLSCANVKYIEQPLPANNILDYGKIVQRCSIPIALDESVFTEQDLINHIELRAINALVLKVSRSAGLYNAFRIGKLALNNGIELLGGGLTESMLGLLGSAHLFASLGIKTPADLNGMQFLADELFVAENITDHKISKTCIELYHSAGIGMQPDEKELNDFRA